MFPLLCAYILLASMSSGFPNLHCDAFEETGGDSYTVYPINRTLSDNSDHSAFSYLFHCDGNQMTRTQFIHSTQMPPCGDTVPMPMETDHFQPPLARSIGHRNHFAAAFISAEKSLDRLSRAARPTVPGAIKGDALSLNYSAVPHDHNAKKFETYSILHRMETDHNTPIYNTNNATRGGCGVTWIVIVIAMFVFILPSSFVSGCPNPQFRMVASHRESFTLELLNKYLRPKEPTILNRYYIAFGRKDKWTLTLVDPQYNDGEFVQFKCKGNQFGAVEVFDTETKGATESEHPICCASSYQFDHVLKAKKPEAERPEAEESAAKKPAPADNYRFPILPEDHCLGLLGKERYYDRKSTAINDLPRKPSIKFYYYRYMSPTGAVSSIHEDLVSRDTAFMKWRILQIDSKEATRLKDWKPKQPQYQMAMAKAKASRESQGKSRRKSAGGAITKTLTGIASGAPGFLVDKLSKPTPRLYPLLPADAIRFKIPRDVRSNSCGSATACDTGIVNDVVVFVVECKKRGTNDYWDQLMSVQLAFSGDGIFNVETIARCGIKGAVFFPVLDLYKDGDKPKYSALVPKWELASFCASCPSTSVSIKVSEKEANTNKKRVSHTISVSGSVGIGAGSDSVKGAVRVGYARQTAKEAARSLVSGQATTIKADCNGFALWHWKLTVGTWGAGRVVVPTHLFYCTDRDARPVCIPRQVSDVIKVTDTPVCNGHDVDDDFKPFEPGQAPTRKEGEWQSMHSGRPKPIRLQGQKEGEPGFKVVTDASSRVIPRMSKQQVTALRLKLRKSGAKRKVVAAASPVVASGKEKVAAGPDTGAHLSFDNQYGGVDGVSAHLPFGDQSGNHLLLRRIHRKRK